MRECEKRLREAVTEIAEHGFDHYNPATHQVVRKGAVVLAPEDVRRAANELELWSEHQRKHERLHAWGQDARTFIDDTAARLRSALASAQESSEEGNDGD